jgi:hypothetical protein
VGSVILVLAVFLCRTNIFLPVALVILLVFYATLVIIPFEACERRARARRRQNNCIFCGRALEKQFSDNPPVCGCRQDAANTPQQQSDSPCGGASREKVVD